MSTPTFTVNSGIGRFQFRQPTPLADSRGHVSPRDVRSSDSGRSAHEAIKACNNQLAQMKEQYLKLRTQYQQEQKVCSMKLLNLQRQLRTEQKEYEEVEAEIHALTSQGVTATEAGSCAVVEQIWQIMQEYRTEPAVVAVKKDPFSVKPESATRSFGHLHVIAEDETEPCFARINSARRRR